MTCHRGRGDIYLLKLLALSLPLCCELIQEESTNKELKVNQACVVTSPLVFAELEALDGVEALTLTVSELRENVIVGTVC